MTDYLALYRSLETDEYPRANSANSAIRSVQEAIGTNGTNGTGTETASKVVNLPDRGHLTADAAERAALIEDGARCPREWAEGYATLLTMMPPGDVPPGRWRQFLDDGGSFLDGDWPARAQALGWTAADLFGADRINPFARIDRAGLLFLLGGSRIVALSETTAVIENREGVRQSYSRTNSAGPPIWKPGHSAET